MKIKPKKAESLGGVIVDYVRATFRFRRKVPVAKVNEIIATHVVQLMDEESKGIASLVLRLQRKAYKDVREITAMAFHNKEKPKAILDLIDERIKELSEENLGEVDSNEAQAISEPRAVKS